MNRGEYVREGTEGSGQEPFLHRDRLYKLSCGLILFPEGLIFHF